MHTSLSAAVQRSILVPSGSTCGCCSVAGQGANPRARQHHLQTRTVEGAERRRCECCRRLQLLVAGPQLGLAFGISPQGGPGRCTEPPPGAMTTLLGGYLRGAKKNETALLATQLQQVIFRCNGANKHAPSPNHTVHYVQIVYTVSLSRAGFNKPCCSL